MKVTTKAGARMLPPLFGWGMVEKFLHNKKTATISMPSDIESHSLFHLIHRRSAVPLPLRGEGLRTPRVVSVIGTSSVTVRRVKLGNFPVILSAAKNLFRRLFVMPRLQSRSWSPGCHRRAQTAPPPHRCAPPAPSPPPHPTQSRWWTTYPPPPIARTRW